MARNTSLRGLTRLFSREGRVERKNRWLNIFCSRRVATGSNSVRGAARLTRLFQHLLVQDKFRSRAARHWSPQLESLEERRLLSASPTDVFLDNSMVDENSGEGTLIGNLTAADDDVNDSWTFSLSNDVGGRFEIVGNRLQVKEDAVLDHEANDSLDVEIQVTDSEGNTLVGGPKTFAIAINDLNEAPTDASLTSNTVPENSPEGTVVGTLLVTDQDAIESQSWTLVDDAGGRFELTDGNKITVAENANLEYEVFGGDPVVRQNVHTIKVNVTDKGGLALGVKELTITVTDETPEAPDSISLAGNNVLEGAANGLIIGSLSATDDDAGDTFTFTLDDDAGGRFDIDGTNLVVLDGSLLEFELAQSHTITVRATSSPDNLFSTREFTINVLDVNEAPTDVLINGTHGATIAEDASNGAEVGILSAVDEDILDLHTFRFAPNGDALFDGGGAFEIVGNRLRVKDSSKLDNEGGANPLTIKVIGRDIEGVDTPVVDLTITIGDANDAPTGVTVGGNTTLSLLENRPDGFVVGTLFAVDQDGAGSNGNAHTFSMIDDAGGRFEIVAVMDDDNLLRTELRVRDGSLLDFESGVTTLQVRILATDGGDPALSGEGTITINITDEEFENLAPNDILLSGTSVDENSSAGTVVGVLSASDPNLPNDIHKFSLTDDAGGRFEVVEIKDGDTTIGWELQVKAGADLNFEVATSHTVKIKVTDQDGTGLSLEKEFIISVNDLLFENRAPNAITIDGDQNNDEHSAAGTVVGTLTVSDPNLPNDVHTLSIAGDQTGGAFGIDGNNLIIVDGSKLDFETNSSPVVTVRATDNLGLTLDVPFTITLNDINDAPTDAALTNNSIPETVGDNATVGTLQVTDQDAVDSHTFELTDDADGRFKLTGNVIQVADSSKINFESAASHEIMVRVTDAGGLTHDAVITISITDQQDDPTDIVLSPDSIIEDGASNGDIVGQLTVTDEDGDVFTITGGVDASGAFELVTSIDHDDDPGTAEIAVNPPEIRVLDATKIDFETQKIHTIVVTAVDVDDASSSITKTIEIKIQNKNEPPTLLDLSGSRSVDENSANGTVVGTLLVGDPDLPPVGEGDTHTFTLTDDAGGRFKVALNATTGFPELQVANGSLLDFEAMAGDPPVSVGQAHSVTVLVTDAVGNTLEKTFTIDVNDVNEAATGIVLTPSAVTEDLDSADVSAARTIGTLSVNDPDGSGASFELLDDGGGMFELVNGNEIQRKAGMRLSFEDAATRTIRVKATDLVDNSLTREQTITILINDANEAPTDITLSNTAIPEDSTPGTPVGVLRVADPDGTVGAVGDSQTFEITAGNAAGLFSLNGNVLEVAAGADLDFDARPGESDNNLHSVTVTTTDSGGAQLTEEFIIEITDVNVAPIDIILGGNDVTEGASSGTLIGQLTADDPDIDPENDPIDGDAHTYSFVVVGEGDDAVTLNAGGRFKIVGNRLEVDDASKLDFEDAVLHSVTIRATDGAGNTHEEAFTINVLDAINEAPKDILLIPDAVLENSANGTEVGVLVPIDDDAGDTHTLAFKVIGSGDSAVTQNADGRFAISGNKLIVADGSKLDFEASAEHTVTVIATDNSGASLELNIVVEIADGNDAPTDLDISNSTVNENASNGSVIGSLSVTDEDAVDAHAYALLNDAGGRFQILGNLLLVKDSSLLDAEMNASHTINVLVVDSGNESFIKELTINVSTVNEAPTGVLLSPASVVENASNGSFVGLLSAVDPDALDAHAFTLLDNAGGRFVLVGNQVRVINGSLLDMSEAASHDIMVLASDSGGLSVVSTLTIMVTEANLAPTDITLDNSTVVETDADGTVVGAIMVADENTADTHTLQILADTSGGAFGIDGGNLVVADSSLLDFTTSPNQVTIIATDSGGLQIVKVLDVTVTEFVPENHAPTVVTDIDDVMVDEDAAPTVIDLSGTFTDEDIAGFGDVLSVSVALNTNESLVTATMDGTDLTLTYAAGESGTATISVIATDLAGAFASSTFDVEVIGAPAPTLQVSDVDVTDSALILTFNRMIDASSLNLYGDAADVIVSGPAGLGGGSLVLNSDNNQLTWIATGGTLPAGNYTITVRSGADAIHDMDGNLLDGNGDGTAGDNYVIQLLSIEEDVVEVSMPDFAAGPGQGIDLPVSVSSGDGISAVDFTLLYDPTQLDITGIDVGASLPGDWAVTTNLGTGNFVPGILNVTAFGITELSAGAADVVSLSAMVPEAAVFGATQILTLANVVVNGGFIDARADQAVHPSSLMSMETNCTRPSMPL